ncbi:MAG: T9SS type A sorting domain-containing protein [Owenweeksia sp.]
MKKLSHLKNMALAFLLMAGLTIPALAQTMAVKENQETKIPGDADKIESRVPDYPLPPPPVVGLEEEEKTKLLKLYPNPNQGQFSIEMEDLGGKEIAIINLVGKEVFHTTVPAYQNKMEIDIQNLNTGFYFLKVDRKVMRFKKL